MPSGFVFYIAGTAEKVWEEFVSPESNRIIFSDAEFQADLKVRGARAWLGPGLDSKLMNCSHRSPRLKHVAHMPLKPGQNVTGRYHPEGK